MSRCWMHCALLSMVERACGSSSLESYAKYTGERLHAPDGGSRSVDDDVLVTQRLFWHSWPSGQSPLDEQYPSTGSQRPSTHCCPAGQSSPSGLHCWHVPLTQ